jgi:3,4-dihydroxy 2-butanone 4-phosphate synthase/GTP cyclohydrolase II
MGAQMLNDLGVKKICLITNNPRKIAGLKGYGLEVVDRVPLLIEANDYNSGYLATKAEKLGHLLLQSFLLAVAVEWETELIAPTERYERLEKLRYLSRSFQLSLQEEVRPVAVALFGKPSLIFHLGFDRANMVTSGWYKSLNHPYRQAVTHIIDKLLTWPSIKRLEFLIASGDDPMLGLQVKLDRQVFSLNQKLSKIDEQLETQIIYSFNQSC